MARPRDPRSGGGSWALRCFPAVALPLLVGILQPSSGWAGVPLILVAAAFGSVLAAAVPHFRLSLLAVPLLTGLLLCVAYVQELEADGKPPSFKNIVQAEQAVQHRLWEAAKDAPIVASRRAVEQVASLRWRGKGFGSGDPSVNLSTFSIVLPCAFEGEFAEKTVRAIWENTKHERIKEILVVDDGSKPPLMTIFSKELLAGGPGQPPVRILRHEKTLGLISAKKTGGDAAVGDIITFLDCHISPRKGWEDAMIKQMKRAGDHRTVVVPVITSLDPNTWQEIRPGAEGKTCYILWNSDFTWLANPGRDAPLMSGGLLALSRKWWEETEGYDEHMVAWGGENIDQSLRAWLCGGRIEVAEGAYVAHMWRDSSNPKTMLRYPIPTKDVMRNKARASKAWFGEFLEKVYSFPEYEQFVQGTPLGDMSNFDRLREKLQCKPFSHYIQRFSYVYLDTGLIPEDIFQIREKATGLCLERKHLDKPPHSVVLAPCGGGEGGGPVPELQWWHKGNRDHGRWGKPCCSGLMNWNFLQCMDSGGLHQQIKTFECEIQGSNHNQYFALENPSGEGQLMWRKGTRQEACLGVIGRTLGAAGLSRQCDTEIVPEGDSTVVLKSGVSVPAKFRLRSKVAVSEQGGACAVAAAAKGPSASGFDLAFSPCSDHDPLQLFHAKKMAGGLQIQVGDTQDCLDSAGGAQALVYPCYLESAENMNQVWHIVNHNLEWTSQQTGTMCVDFTSPAKQAPAKKLLDLQICTPKSGQRFEKQDEKDGTFLLRDRDGEGCLIKQDKAGVGVGPCDEHERWRVLPEKEQVQHVTTGMCLDAGMGRGSSGAVNLYACHVPRAQPKQKFTFVEEPGWLQLAGSWGDNGRKRWFPRCVDHQPQEPVDVALQECKKVRTTSTAWERIHITAPTERRLWDKADKPSSSDPPLGGDMAPP